MNHSLAGRASSGGGLDNRVSRHGRLRDHARTDERRLDAIR